MDDANQETDPGIVAAEARDAAAVAAGTLIRCKPWGEGQGNFVLVEAHQFDPDFHVALDPLDHDGDGHKGGSKPAKPPGLVGKSLAQLLAIAADEDVTEAADDDGAVIPIADAKAKQISAAITAARDAKAS